MCTFSFMIVVDVWSFSFNVSKYLWKLGRRPGHSIIYSKTNILNEGEELAYSHFPKLSHFINAR